MDSRESKILAGKLITLTSEKRMAESSIGLKSISAPKKVNFFYLNLECILVISLRIMKKKNV